MNIKKLASLLFQRSVIVALLIFLQAAMLLLYMLWFSSDFIYVYWGCVVLSILAVLIIVSRQTDPGYKIAWIIPILLFPAFGWLVYLLCGGNKLSARKRRKMQGMDRTMLEQLERDYKAEELRPFGADAVNQARYLEHYARCPVYTNTYTHYFPLGDDVFPAMLEELRKAEKYIFLEYFIISPGIFWDSMVEILKEKHAAGVDVRVIYDDVGSLNTLPMNYARKFETETGIPCCCFNRFKPVISIRMNNRAHRLYRRHQPGRRVYQPKAAVWPLERHGHSPQGGGGVEHDRHVPDHVGVHPGRGGGLPPLPAGQAAAGGRAGSGVLCPALRG